MSVWSDHRTNKKRQNVGGGAAVGNTVQTRPGVTAVLWSYFRWWVRSEEKPCPTSTAPREAWSPRCITPDRNDQETTEVSCVLTRQELYLEPEGLRGSQSSTGWKGLTQAIQLEFTQLYTEVKTVFWASKGFHLIYFSSTTSRPSTLHN